MTGVDRMAFALSAASGLPQSANKERSGFCWDGLAEAGSADFFEQFIELGDSDSESITGGGGGLGHLYGASGLAISPQPSAGQMLHADRAVQIAGAVPRQQGHLLPPGVMNSSAASSGSARVSRQRMHPLHRATSNMADYHSPGIGLDDMSYSTSFGEAPGGGSISDSELLKLEGLTMRSPRLVIPQLSASVPASPPSDTISPRKASRLEAFCSKIRNKAATLQGKPRQQVEVKLEPASQASLSAPIMSTAQMGEPVRGRSRPQNLNLSGQHLPLSPPLTGAMSGAHRQVAGSNGNGDAAFINGLLDDPFIPEGLLNGQFVPPLQLNGDTMPQTPLQTPLMDAWQLPLSNPNNKQLWAPSAPSPYFGVNDHSVNNWWDPSADAMDTDPLPGSLPLSYHTTANARNASLNLAIQLQHQPSFEYPAPPGTEDTTSFASNGLMIHMPQPRGVPSAVLHTDANHRPTRADHHHRRPKPRAPSSGARHHQYGPGMSPRKARSTSGSTNGGGSASSSPKASARRTVASSSSSSSLLTAPGGANPATGGGSRRLHRRSASMQTLNHSISSSSLTAPSEGGPTAIRKRRSWTGRHRISSSSSSSLHHQYHAHTLGVGPSPGRRRNNRGVDPSSSSSSSIHTISHNNGLSSSVPNTSNLPHPHPADLPSGGGNGGGGGGRDGFVNYTPQDRTLLMTGVAPSGSSKTKARREREAAERQREFRDRLARMVQAAGGGVSQLELEGNGGGGSSMGGGYEGVEGMDGMGGL